MKLLFSAVLAVSCMAKSSMLPFLLSQDFQGDSMLPLLAATGNLKSNMMPLLLASRQQQQPYDMMTTLALSGLDSKKMNDFTLPFLVNSMSQQPNPSLSQDMFPMMMMLNQDIKPESMIPFMMTSGQRYSGMLPFLLADDEVKIGSKDVLPWMVASGQGFGNQGNIMPFLLAGDKNVDMTLPLMVNSMSHGRTPSLSQHVLPAMMMLDGKVKTENLLPFIMTSGQRYAGNMMPFLAAGGKDFDVDGILPWMIAEQMNQPKPMPHYPAYKPAYNLIRRDPIGSTFHHSNTITAPRVIQPFESVQGPAPQALFDTFQDQEQATGIDTPAV